MKQFCANWLSTIGIIKLILHNMVSDVRKKFADKIYSLRKERNLTQEALAFQCNIDRTYIGRIERTERNPSLDVLQNIADGLKIPLHELLTFDD